MLKKYQTNRELIEIGFKKSLTFNKSNLLVLRNTRNLQKRLNFSKSLKVSVEMLNYPNLFHLKNLRMSGEKPLTNKQAIYSKIKEYYQLAKDYLDRDDEKMAFNILYKDMPNELYDISLDMLFNRNMDKDTDMTDIIDLIKE